MSVPAVEVFVTIGTVQDLSNLVQSVTISRGKSRQLEQFNSGSATVVFKNSSRILDPLNQSSSLYPNVLPRVRIEIKANNISIFNGLVVDWNIDYDMTGQDIMTAICSDDFTVLANQTLSAFTPGAQLSGNRVSTVLARPEVDFTGAVSIDAGVSSLGAYAVSANTNVLNYLHLITKSEQGFLYISADGTLVFKSRNSVLNVVPNAEFADDGSGISYQNLNNEFGDELLYNYIVTESPAGGPFVASDVTSQALYQFQQYVLNDLLNLSTIELQDLGNYLLGKYKDPAVRFTGLGVQLSGMSLADQNICLSLDLVDICSAKKSFTVGTPTSVTQNLILSGIDHSIAPASHTITYTFEPADLNQYFILDNSNFGVLDQNLLSF